MQPDRILGDFDGGVSRDGVTVFRFRSGSALVGAVVSAVIVSASIAFALVAAPAVKQPATGAAYGAGAVLVFVVLMGLLALRRNLAALRHAGNNVLVVSPEGVVRRLGGRVNAWPFTAKPDLTIVLGSKRGRRTVRVRLGARPLDAELVESSFYAGRIESVYLNDAGGSFQHEVADDGSFGSHSAIVEAIVRAAPPAA